MGPKKSVRWREKTCGAQDICKLPKVSTFHQFHFPSSLSLVIQTDSNSGVKRQENGTLQDWQNMAIKMNKYCVTLVFKTDIKLSKGTFGNMNESEESESGRLLSNFNISRAHKLSLSISEFSWDHKFYFPIITSLSIFTLSLSNSSLSLVAWYSFWNWEGCEC